MSAWRQPSRWRDERNARTGCAWLIFAFLAGAAFWSLVLILLTLS